MPKYKDSDLKILIDFNNIAHIAKYAMDGLSIDEMQTGVIFGFLGKTLQIAKQYGAENLVFCCDSRRSFREKLFPEYKEGRTKNKTEEQKEQDYYAYPQFDLLRKEILPYMGFNNIFIQPGYEADDIMAYLCDYKRKYNTRTSQSYVIITTDKDLYQILWRHKKFNRYNIIYNPITKKSITPESFIKTYGINPEQWAEAKAIGGCDGDGVPGIVGAADVAKSKTSKVLKYLKGELTSGKIFDKIESNEGQAIIERNRLLVELPLNYDKKPLKEMEFKENNFTKEAFVEIFDRYKFLSFLKDEAFEKWIETFNL